MSHSDSLASIVTAHRTPIARMLRAIAGASIAATLGAGCSDARFSTPGFEAITCEDDGRLGLLARASMPEPHDHLLAASFSVDGAPSIVDQVGEACAAPAPGCADALESAWRMGPRAVISTDGGIITRFDREEGVRELLGAIDTPADALLLAWSAGYDLSCGAGDRSAVREVEGGYEVIATQLTEICDPIITERFLLFVRTEGTIEVLAHEEISRSSACIGRRPEGLAPPRDEGGGTALGAHLAEIARLEASAVIAFEILERELAALGAPAALLAAIREARADEVRHAEVMSALACARGGVVEAPSVTPRPLRDALAIALENAVEGCVRETYGAIVGLHQAACAEDAALRAAMRAVAEDELRHAELSWRIAAFLEPMLSPAERHLVEQARRSALLALRAEATMPIAPELARPLGMPMPEVALGIVRQLEAAVAA